MSKLLLEIKDFTSENEIDMAKDVLCLVSSWGELPYFLVMQRKECGMVNAFDGSIIENIKILEWAYLPENKL